MAPTRTRQWTQHRMKNRINRNDSKLSYSQRSSKLQMERKKLMKKKKEEETRRDSLDQKQRATNVKNRKGNLAAQKSRANKEITSIDQQIALIDAQMEIINVQVEKDELKNYVDSLELANKRLNDENDNLKAELEQYQQQQQQQEQGQQQQQQQQQYEEQYEEQQFQQQPQLQYEQNDNDQQHPVGEFYAGGANEGRFTPTTFLVTAKSSDPPIGMINLIQEASTAADWDALYEEICGTAVDMGIDSALNGEGSFGLVFP